MGFLNDAGVATLWSRIRSYMTGDHVKTSAVNNATNVDQALTALNTTNNAVESGLAVVANGDTHAAIASGQYVYVKNHSSLTEGLYKTTAAVDANGSLVNKVESASNVLSQQSQQIGDLNSALSGGDVLRNVDLNDYKTAGAWVIGDVRTVTNAPATSLSGYYGTLYVRKNYGFLKQIFIGENGSAIRQSNDLGSSWGTWQAYGSRPLQSGLAIVTEGDLHTAIAKGQYVYIRKHSSLIEGLYTANDNIESNGALSGKVTAASGGLNALKSSIDTLNTTLANRLPYFQSVLGTATIKAVDITLSYNKQVVLVMSSNNYAGGLLGIVGMEVWNGSPSMTVETIDQNNNIIRLSGFNSYSGKIYMLSFDPFTATGYETN